MQSSRETECLPGERLGEMAIGLLFIDENGADMHAVAKTVETPLVELPFETLCPGQTALQALMEKYR
jgi:2-oxoglutarate ferredoxin oxidoreductase subunit beta